MTNLLRFTSCLMVAAMCSAGCSKSGDSTPAATGPKTPAAAEHAHGAGPNGGILFDLGSYHAEFTVNHGKQECTILVIGDDEKTPTAIAATELILTINETKTADGKVVSPMTLVVLPVDSSNGKATTFVGTDSGIANVADFAGTVSGQIDGKPAMGEFDEAAGGHAHAHSTPHDGVVAVLNDGSGGNAGFVELKLHDDKGDLEAWLGKDREMKEPFDMPADTIINVSFKDHSGKTATLSVRNKQQNEDEDGNATLRGGMTNYFIFPGNSGQDPSWLMGQEFRSTVQLSFTANGKSYRSEEFVLVPHTHADGQEHGH